MMWLHVMQTLRSYEASLLAGTIVIWVALMSYALLGERPTPHEWTGIAIMLVGMTLIQLPPKRRRSDAAV